MAGKNKRKQGNRDERERLSALTTEELETLVPALHREIAEISKPVGILKARLRFITDELRERKLGRVGLIISDHAVVRYLERTGRVDIDAVRDEIVTLATRAKGNGHRRLCDETGLTVAFDATSQIVATVYRPNEIDVLNSPSPQPSASPISGREE